MKKKLVYKCENCGYESAGKIGRCPYCGTWGSMKELNFTEKDNINEEGAAAKVYGKLIDSKKDNSERFKSSYGEFDRVMGGGTIRDSMTILSARPGSGKSTLLLQLANDYALREGKAIYISAEESESQIKQRADRILEKISDRLFILCESNMENIEKNIVESGADFVVLDSIQTVELKEFRPSRPSSPTQTVECAARMLDLAKDTSHPRTVFLVGQMTKDDELRGVRTLEHMVDTVLIIEDYKEERLRVILAKKNRYGGTGETGFLEMTEKGLCSINNPSTFFISEKEEKNYPGSAVTCIMEGTRPVLIEVESLVSRTFTPFPMRISDNISREKLNTLISVLEERLGVDMYDKNVVIKTPGGIRLREDAVNLAVAASVLSSIKKKPVKKDSIFIADIALTGQLKRVSSIEKRLKEAERLGYKRAVVAKAEKVDDKNFSMKIIKLEHISALEELL